MEERIWICILGFRCLVSLGALRVPAAGFLQGVSLKDFAWWSGTLVIKVRL